MEGLDVAGAQAPPLAPPHLPSLDPASEGEEGTDASTTDTAIVRQVPPWVGNSLEWVQKRPVAVRNCPVNHDLSNVPCDAPVDRCFFLLFHHQRLSALPVICSVPQAGLK